MKCFVARIADTNVVDRQGILKAKLAKLRTQLIEGGKSSGAKGEGFDVLKSGDARVSLIGFPSVGKSVSHRLRNECLGLKPKLSRLILLIVFECRVCYHVSSDSFLIIAHGRAHCWATLC